MKRIVVREDLCTGCRACQVACVAYHEGCFGTATARIRVSKNEPLGLSHPHVCQLCCEAPCVASCPVGALTRDPSSGAVLVCSERCIGCGTCADACPFEMVAFRDDDGLPLICDLCGGEPACVGRCATGAIVYRESEEAGAHG